MFKTLWVVIFIKCKRFILLKRFFPDPDLGNSRILSRAKHSDKARNWLQLPASEWEQQDSYRALEHFVKSLACVNDPSERKIKLIQDYVLVLKVRRRGRKFYFLPIRIGQFWNMMKWLRKWWHVISMDSSVVYRGGQRYITPPPEPSAGGGGLRHPPEQMSLLTSARLS